MNYKLCYTKKRENYKKMHYKCFENINKVFEFIKVRPNIHVEFIIDQDILN